MNIFMNPQEGRFRAGWRLIGQLFLMYVVGLSLVSLTAQAFPSATGPVLPTLAIATGALVSLLLAVRGLDQRPWRQLGLTFTPQSGQRYLLGFAVGGLAMSLIFLIEYTAGWVAITGFGWEHSFGGASFWRILGSYFIFMLVVGFYEELVFRGYQIINLSEGLNISGVSRKQALIGAVGLGSLGFGLAHAANPSAGWISTINVALAGGMLALPFIITGRLSISIGLHIGWNFFQGGVFGFRVSGIAARASLVQIHQQGPAYLTGGGFGPEAGLLGLMGIFLIIPAMIFYLKISGQPLTIYPGLGTYPSSSRV